jgi:hypothetical protein
MNRLNGLSAYLSGGIDFDPTMGREWRDDMTSFLEPRNVRVFNPLKHIFYGSQEIDTVKRPRMKKMLEDGDFEGLKNEMKSLVHMDLHAVDLASFLICSYNVNIHMCGTIEESTLANKQQKPILIMAKNGKKKLPSWIYGRMPWQHFFESWDELKEYIKNIDENPDYVFTECDKKRWLFFDGIHMSNDPADQKMLRKTPIVIIESPFSGEVERNKKYAQRAMLDSLLQGEAPYVSHLLYTQCLEDTISEERELGMNAGWAFIERSDFTAVYDDYGISKGMQGGIDIALKLNKKIVYRQIGRN